MLTEIRTRLSTQLASMLKLVGGAAEFQAAAERNPTATPAAFVYFVSENAAPCGDVPMVIQRVTAAIAVVYCICNVSDATGAAAQTDIDTLRAAGKAALLGWQPVTDSNPLERGASKLLAFRDGHMWWQDIYNTVYYDKEAA